MFRNNDLEEIYYAYFEEMWQTERVYADPSGWTDTFATSAPLIPKVDIQESDLGRYYLDEANNLGQHKERICHLMSEWEEKVVAPNQLTLYNSVSTACAAVLLALKRRGVRSISFETPAYSVTINQAKALGLEACLIPTYRRDTFELPVDIDLLRSKSPCAVWLTQPRISLGIDQSKRTIEKLNAALSDQDFLVIDEATEQKFPSLLRFLEGERRGCTVLRIRGLLKGAGLNGIRLAMVLHPISFRESLEDVQSVLGASLDAWSLHVASTLAMDTEYFKTILLTANQQACGLRKKVQSLTLGSGLWASPLVNGYMGSLFIDLENTGDNFMSARQDMLAFLKNKRIPVILGSTLLFAFEPPWEQIRINYFNRDHHVLRLVEQLLVFDRRRR